MIILLSYSKLKCHTGWLTPSWPAVKQTLGGGFNPQPSRIPIHQDDIFARKYLNPFPCSALPPPPPSLTRTQKDDDI